jgi:hypothetical protein
LIFDEHFPIQIQQQTRDLYRLLASPVGPIKLSDV